MQLVLFMGLQVNELTAVVYSYPRMNTIICSVLIEKVHSFLIHTYITSAYIV